MKNPNGYGSIIKLSGKRRKPFAVRVTTGYSSEGKQIFKYIGYAETRKQAMLVLSEYNQNPYDLNIENFTFLDMLNKFTEYKKDKIGEGRRKNLESQIKKFEPLYLLNFKDIKLKNYQLLFDSLSNDLSTGTLKMLKSIVTSVYDYAIKIEMADKNIGKYIDLPKHKKVLNRRIFNTNEIEILKTDAEKGELYAKILYTLIYTGFRVNELINMKKDKVDLVNRTLTGGSKTVAGQDRVVPIHPKIYELIKNEMMKNKTYLFEKEDMKPVTYKKMYDSAKTYLAIRGMEHTIHDTRHTFATLLTEVSTNKSAITKIIGHANISMTEQYIHTNIEKMRKEIEKIN